MSCSSGIINSEPGMISKTSNRDRELSFGQNLALVYRKSKLEISEKVKGKEELGSKFLVG